MIGKYYNTKVDNTGQQAMENAHPTIFIVVLRLKGQIHGLHADSWM